MAQIQLIDAEVEANVILIEQRQEQQKKAYLEKQMWLQQLKQRNETSDKMNDDLTQTNDVEKVLLENGQLTKTQTGVADLPDWPDMPQSVDPEAQLN